MIKILEHKITSPHTLELQFSNGEAGKFDGIAYLKSRTGVLLNPLNDASYFSKCFIDAGALCWPNGLELSGGRVFELCQILSCTEV